MLAVGFIGTVARGFLPGRRVAGAVVVVAASGLLGTTDVGTDSFDDFVDMIENFLSRVEELREPFRNRLKGMLLLAEKRFVDDGEVGWQTAVS